MIEQGRRRGVQVTGGPAAYRLKRTVQSETRNDDLTGVELTHARANHMHVDRAWVFLARLGHLLVLRRFQTCGVLIQAHPMALPLSIEYPQHPIGLQPAGNQKASFPRGAPDTFAGIPAVHQDMRQGVGYRLEVSNGCFHHLHLALEGNAFPFTHGFLAIHLRGQRTPPPQQHLQALHQTVTGYALFGGRRVVLAQAAHLFPLGFVLRRVIPPQIAGHDRFSRTSGAFRTMVALPCQ